MMDADAPMFDERGNRVAPRFGKEQTFSSRKLMRNLSQLFRNCFKSCACSPPRKTKNLVAPPYVAGYAVGYWRAFPPRRGGATVLFMIF